jgi:propionyl-CoA carboxylase alpha chain
MPKKEQIDTAKFVQSPMPGKVVHVNVKAGDKVVVGEGVITIEAMKMRNVLRAERDGVVKKASSNQIATS